MHFHRFPALACLALLAGCQSAKVAEPPASDQEWHASTLSPTTIAKAEAAVQEYHSCLTWEMAARINERGDPRAITNTILKACEDRLPAIKTAYDAEQVPAVISERYIRKTRSQGVQSVLRQVSAIQAERAGQEEEAKRAAEAQKSQPKHTKAAPLKHKPK